MKHLMMLLSLLLVLVAGGWLCVAESQAEPLRQLYPTEMPVDADLAVADPTVKQIDPATVHLIALPETDVDTDQPVDQPLAEQKAEQKAEPIANGAVATLNTETQSPDKPSQPVEADQLLAFIDSLRGYQGQSFGFDLYNISYKNNVQEHSNQLTVKVLNDASLVEFVAPARSKGRKILKQGQNMWIRFPGTKNVLRISPAQRLLGEASNGDVTGTNFSEDYNAVLEGSVLADETGPSDGKTALKLVLTAKHDNATYHSVVFFLDSDSHLPLRSDFFARSGKLAKQAYYTKFKTFNGELKLHRMRLVDPFIDGSFTWMMFDNYQPTTLDPAVFHKDALAR